MKTINLNDSVKVKLNDLGRKIIVESFTKASAAYKEDENGYVRMQLWEMLQIFGPYIGLGYEMPFVDTDILIELEGGDG